MFYVNSSHASSTLSAPVKTTCRSWEQGRCSRGSYCRYMHASSPFSSPLSFSSSISEPATFSDNSTNINSNLNSYSDTSDDWNTGFDQLTHSHAANGKNALNPSITMLHRMSNNLHSVLSDKSHHDIGHQQHHHHHQQQQQQQQQQHSAQLSSDANSFVNPFSSSNPFGITKKDCWDWLSGRCTRGVTCKYAHTKGGTNEMDDSHANFNQSAFQYTMNNAHSNIMSTPPRRASFDSEVDALRKSKQAPLPFASASLGNELMQTTDEDVEVCRFYAKHGRCKYGTTCKFIHIHPSLQTAAFLSSHFSFNQLQQAGFIDRDGNFTALHHSHAHSTSHSAPSSLVSSPGNLTSQHPQHLNAFSSSTSGNTSGNANSSASNSSFLSLPSRAITNQNTSIRGNLSSSFSPLASSHASPQIGMTSKYLGNYHDIPAGPANDPFPAFNPHGGSHSNARSGTQYPIIQTATRKHSGQLEPFYDEEYDRPYENPSYDYFDPFLSKEVDSENDDSIIQNATPPLHSFLSISTTQSPNQSRANSPTLPTKFTSFYSQSPEQLIGSQTDFNIA